MICILCGSRDYDGAFDDHDDFICVDCWATGEAVGHIAKMASPAPFAFPVKYPAETLNRFVNACNKANGGK